MREISFKFSDLRAAMNVIFVGNISTGYKCSYSELKVKHVEYDFVVFRYTRAV